MGEILKRLGARIVGGMFGLGLLIGGVLGVYEGNKPEHQQQPWQRDLNDLAKYMDKMAKPPTPDQCRGARARLLRAREADGAPTYILDRLEEQLNKMCG